MKALTLWQPWSHAVAHQGKWIENRTWKPPAFLLDQLLAIHAGKKLDAEALCWFAQNGYPRIGAANFTFGAVEAVARLRGAVCRSEDGTLVVMGRITHDQAQDVVRSQWYAGSGWAWVLAEVYTLPQPYPCRGAQGLWELSISAAARLATAHAETLATGSR